MCIRMEVPDHKEATAAKPGNDHRLNLPLAARGPSVDDGTYRALRRLWE